MVRTFEARAGFEAKPRVECVAFLSTILHFHPHKMSITRRRRKNAALEGASREIAGDDADFERAGRSG